jgi:glycine cleavage system H lipoate-binding protein
MNLINKREKVAGQHPPCIWMQAGVVHRKYCANEYDCAECNFDMVMSRVARENMSMRQSGTIPEGKRGRIVSWKEKLKSMPLTKRPCIHHMKGRIEFRTCTNEYNCGNCSFDQFFNDQFSVHAVVNPVNVLSVDGFNIPQGYYFHKGHTWVKIEEGTSARIGIDDFALRLLGPLDTIKAPLIGKRVRQDDADIQVTRGNNQAGVLSPVSGVVTAINSPLREKGSIANDDPYSNGWVLTVQPDNLREDLKKLMINMESGEFIKNQVHELYRIVENVSGPMAADGGNFSNDIFGSMPNLGWERLIKVFLHT